MVCANVCTNACRLYPCLQASVEASLAKKEQELLDFLLMQKQSVLAEEDAVILTRRMEAAEAEAAVRSSALQPRTFEHGNKLSSMLYLEHFSDMES